MNRLEMQRLLEERQKRIDLLTRRADSMAKLIDTYQERDKTIVEAMVEARNTVDCLLSDAEQRAEAILLSAKQEADEQLEAAREEARETMQRARTEADQLRGDAINESESIRTAARLESERLLRTARQSLSQQQETIAEYNRLIEESALQAIRNTNRYVSYLKERGVELPEAPEAGAEDVIVLTDAGDDAAKLMQNIYRLQRRNIPKDFVDRRAEQAPTAAPQGMDAFEPRPCEDAEEAKPNLECEGTAAKDAGQVDIPVPEEAATDEMNEENESEAAKPETVSLDDLLEEIIKSGEHSQWLRTRTKNL